MEPARHALAWCPEEDPRFDPVRHRITKRWAEGLSSTMVIGDFLWRRLVPLQECSRLAWLYTGDHEETQMHVGETHNWRQDELTMMLRVVVSIGNVTTSTLPREDLALYNNPRRVALQETLPRCNAKEI
ncbi:hypothetical protein E2562_022827 [Oryza meyeriana var. granulata]|uniref:Uncharacterized protein n=1 Tax=Oryza meyeriana var. granulata TaxID=110450 RepID=A0A6G1FBC5_9ORYZ|nr:hypothetical protein E2562_022827 [Oryza meyeriana var. granulata]